MSSGHPICGATAGSTHPGRLESKSIIGSSAGGAKATFPTLRKEMKAVQWGLLYNEVKDAELDPVKFEAQVSNLMADEDVTKSVERGSSDSAW